jgi:hypothetical protein
LQVPARLKKFHDVVEWLEMPAEADDSASFREKSANPRWLGRKKRWSVVASV